MGGRKGGSRKEREGLEAFYNDLTANLCRDEGGDGGSDGGGGQRDGGGGQGDGGGGDHGGGGGGDGGEAEGGDGRDVACPSHSFDVENGAEGGTASATKRRRGRQLNGNNRYGAVMRRRGRRGRRGRREDGPRHGLSLGQHLRPMLLEILGQDLHSAPGPANSWDDASVVVCTRSHVQLRRACVLDVVSL